MLNMLTHATFFLFQRGEDAEPLGKDGERLLEDYEPEEDNRFSDDYIFAAYVAS